MNHKTSDKGMWIKILSGGIIVAICAVGIIYGIKWHHSQIVVMDKKRNMECKSRIQALEKQIAILENDLAEVDKTPAPPEIVSQLFNFETTADSDAVLPCNQVKSNIDHFFTYLDNQGYTETLEEKPSHKDWFSSLVVRLEKNEPLFSDQSIGPLDMFRSMSYFCRIFGIQNIKVIKNILENEKDILEPAMRAFYTASLQTPNCDSFSGPKLSFNTLYRYSCYLLNTISGKSYLLRRNSKIRILSTYYAILIVDQANEQVKNTYGYNLRPIIPLIIDDIENHIGFIYQTHYLEKLNLILEKYSPVLSQ